MSVPQQSTAVALRSISSTRPNAGLTDCLAGRRMTPWSAPEVRGASPLNVRGARLDYALQVVSKLGGGSAVDTRKQVSG